MNTWFYKPAEKDGKENSETIEINDASAVFSWDPKLKVLQIILYLHNQGTICHNLTDLSIHDCIAMLEAINKSNNRHKNFLEHNKKTVYTADPPKS